MKAVGIVDTTILCNVLDVPNMNSDRASVMHELQEFIDNGTNLLLPMASVIETGKHIANLPDGRIRRQHAAKLVEHVRQAISGGPPWQAMQLPIMEEIHEWLSCFPDNAMRGIGMADVSIIKEWEKAKRKMPNRRIFIWSLDGDLQGYR